MRIRGTRWCWAVGLALAGPVLAQTAPEPADGPAAATGEMPTIPVAQPAEAAPEPVQENAEAPAQLEEIVVTATKREASLREIPASITAVNGGDLERSGAAGIEDIARRVPGVNVATENGIQRITIRGISAANNTNATTGTLFGNVSFVDQYVPIASLDPQPFDLKGVEVLKGPQGTLFGASALNGAIRYVPEPAVLGEFSAKYFGQYTSVEHGSADPAFGAAVNLPFGDTMALRVVGFDRKSPGWVDNQQLDLEDSNYLTQYGVRALARWEPNEDWSVSMIGTLQKTAVNDNMLSDSDDGQLSSDNRPRRSPFSNLYHLAGLTVERRFDWAQVVSESAWIGKDSRNFFDNTRNAIPGAPIAFLGIDGTGESDTYTQEFRLVSPDDADAHWRWIVGVFGSRQEIRDEIDLAAGNSLLPPALNLQLLDQLIPGLGSLANDSGNVSLIDLNPHVTIKELALFGNVTRKLGESVELTLGGRLYKTRSEGTNTQRGVVYTVLNGTPAFTKRGGVIEKSFNPQASLSWHITDEVLTYAAASKGFRVGGLQPGTTLPTSNTQAPAVFKSDTIWNYELGVRTEWFDRTLSVDVVGFYIDWNNPQTQQPDSTSGIVYLDNAGGVKSPGVDFALQWITPFRLMVATSATYAKTETTKEFQTGSGRIAMPGDPWPYAPKLQTATTLSYPIELGSWAVTTSVTHTYLGKTVNDLGEQRKIFDYHQLDAQIGLLSTSWSWFPEITLTVNNVLDERSVVADIVQGTARDVTYNQPRTFIVRLSGSF